jgi:hypothetical protein
LYRIELHKTLTGQTHTTNNTATGHMRSRWCAWLPHLAPPPLWFGGRAVGGWGRSLARSVLGWVWGGLRRSFAPFGLSGGFPGCRSAVCIHHKIAPRPVSQRTYCIHHEGPPPLYPSRARLKEVDSQGVGVLVVVPRASRDAEQRVAESSNGSGLPRIHTCAATFEPMAYLRRECS